MIPRIKRIAAYQIRPVSAITHVAQVSAIEPYKDTGKCLVAFSAPAQQIEPIKLVPKGRVKALQSLRYTSYEKLMAAKTLEEVF